MPLRTSLAVLRNQSRVPRAGAWLAALALWSLPGNGLAQDEPTPPASAVEKPVEEAPAAAPETAAEPAASPAPAGEPPSAAPGESGAPEAADAEDAAAGSEAPSEPSGSQDTNQASGPPAGQPPQPAQSSPGRTVVPPQPRTQVVTPAAAEVVQPADPTSEPLLAGPSRVIVALGPQWSWLSDRGYERAGSQSFVGFHGLAGYDVARLGADLTLSVEAAVDLSSQQREDGAPQEVSVESHAFTAALVSRAALTPWLWPHVRVGVGGLRTRLRVHGTGELPARSEQDWGYAVDLSAGFAVGAPEGALRTRRGKLATLTPLVRVSVGYRLAPDAEFPAGEQTPDEEGAIELTRSGLGSLARSGLLLRVVGGLRF